MKLNELNSIIVFADGGCKGNGSEDAQMYGSFHVIAVSEGCTKHTSVRINRFDFGHGTNNEAEYLAAIEAAKYVADLRKHIGSLPVEITTDSALVYGQCVEGYKVRANNLKPLNYELKNYLLMSGAKMRKVDRNVSVSFLGH